MNDAPTPAPPALRPSDPDWESRVRASFARQRFAARIGATFEHAAPGTVELGLPFDADLTQQHGFLHGGVLATGLDVACGYAAATLMPADSGVLTVEFKVNFLAPARGGRFRFVARVRRAGRTVTFVESEAIAVDGDRARLVATAQATMMTVLGRDDVRH